MGSFVLRMSNTEVGTKSRKRSSVRRRNSRAFTKTKDLNLRFVLVAFWCVSNLRKIYEAWSWWPRKGAKHQWIASRMWSTDDLLQWIEAPMTCCDESKRRLLALHWLLAARKHGTDAMTWIAAWNHSTDDWPQEGEAPLTPFVRKSSKLEIFVH